MIEITKQNREAGMNITATALVLVSVIATSGCMSLWSYEASKREIQKDRIVASGNQKAIHLLAAGCEPDVAIRAVAMEGGAGIGVDVANLSALQKHPVRQSVAALLDFGAIYGGYRYAERLNDRRSESDRDAGTQYNQNAGRDTITIVVPGSGNTIEIGDRPITTTTATTTTTTAPAAP